ncbi:Holliday junction branch migration protein RuvA [Mycoplasma sp. CSL10137]|uniref:Holliday junction branch migration protein RuvA n=1 Tax=unclassified Mycoplasma TaxID=2683645 RepID=UPI00197BD044|nr:MULTISPECIES: Holliday junction branch migration protein RuvA [unclassified Mycoplasma]MBN4083535.1 Holliday junction branch migration protein RuvA [Mycoplasma sp. CSL10137]MBN4084535.1 Holliday junction branch migration protein RuvA [Mycoplasma sp. CSL10166]MBU4693013.1 Holliday junction branch migration protein RuvA [Mycoplasma sp. CSL7491-lung]
MILYKIGEIVYKNKNNLIFESKGDGYMLSVPDLNRFEVGQKIKLYIYEHATDYVKKYFGFKDFKERILFLDLISIDKIGPKIGLNILEKGWENIAIAIANNNWTILSECSFVSEKTAKLICVELKDKWSKMVKKEDLKISDESRKKHELKETLFMLGFKKQEIDFALNNIKEKNNIDKMVEEGINLITINYKNENQRTQA